MQTIEKRAVKRALGDATPIQEKKMRRLISELFVNQLKEFNLGFDQKKVLYMLAKRGDREQILHLTTTLLYW